MMRVPEGGQRRARMLVTGGAGFIGCHVCERLLKEGHAVVAADDLSLGTWSNIAHLEAHGDFRFFELDVSDCELLAGLLRESRVDCVFHLAANSDIARSRADPSVDLVNTFRTTCAVLEAMRKSAVREIVFASTSAVYGEASGRLSESVGPLLPISHYGAAKLASEAFIASYSASYDIQSWIARFPNVVGDRVTHGVILDLARKLRATPGRLVVLGDGNQIKPYLHVDDLIAAILLARQRLHEPVNLFNVGGTTRATVKRIAEIVVEESGLDARIEYTGGDRGWVGDVPSVDYDTAKIRGLGWSPRLDSESAVRASARWVFRHMT